MKAGSRQSLFDIAVQECGSVEAVFDFAALTGLSVTSDIDAAEIKVPEVVDEKVVMTMRINSIKPATAITEENEAVPLGGIGYMAISVDFIIS